MLGILLWGIFDLITPLQWSVFRYLRPSDFSRPDEMTFAAVSRLDQLATRIGSKPLILSDKRNFSESNPNSQHFLGTAIDSTWPGVPSLRVVNATEGSGLYANDGFGAYVNEAGVASFHHDTRGRRARWGGMITHPVDGTGRQFKRIEYTGINAVVDLLSRGLGTVVEVISDLPTEQKSLGILLIFGIITFMIFKRR